MSFLTKFFKKESNETESGVSKISVEEFSMLIRVYYQSVIAINIGITNLNMLPDLALFKRMLKVPTQNNKIGLAEKSKAMKILMQDYNMPSFFFDEIDQSIKKNCRTPQQVQAYFAQFQGFNNDLFTLMDSMMQIKFRVAMIFNKLLRSVTEKNVHDIMTKNDWKDVSVRKIALRVRKYAQTLNFSEAWMTEYVYNILTLAKKGAKNNKKNKEE